jgi:hypothetical protein
MVARMLGDVVAGNLGVSEEAVRCFAYQCKRGQNWRVMRDTGGKTVLVMRQRCVYVGVGKVVCKKELANAYLSYY